MNKFFRRALVIFVLFSFLISGTAIACQGGKTCSKSISMKNVNGIDVVTVVTGCGNHFKLYMKDGRYITEAEAFDIIHGKKVGV